ncbi:hypothetical protein PA598K_04437 [Paenibacillus sp. 598K]|uniref:hypothetical protein n=1 Tax=Paenibacillus sp. 598K TaxID=1117987 RepID=UPI000FFAE3F7|nr:hypothetical protein [Paenibacillus sp. 598K]GBF75998.1 hypothetical protein PA598K_04437 [Paenibacillus sp. 598K]
MVKLNLQIAEHRFEVTTYASELADFLSANYLPADPSEQPPDMMLVIHDGYGRPFETYDVAASASDGVLLFVRSDYRIDVDEDFTRASVQVHDTFALKHAMMNLYSAFAAQRGWGLLLHSSCIMEREQAYLFAGPSGAGKSTVALLSQPRPVLSDEATIVKIGEGETIVYDSPFRSDSGPPSRREGVPLSAIQLLRQSQHIHRQRLPQMDGLMGIMDKVFFWAADVAQTQQVMRLCHKLATNVPVYELQFQKNDRFWEAISL